MTGLQVWLHPSSRTINERAARLTPCPSNTKSDSAAFRRTASVVRNRSSVLDVPHFDSSGGQGSDGGLASGTRATDAYFDAADAVIAGHTGGVRSCLLGGEWGTLTGSAEPQRAGTLPGKHVASLVADGHDGVIERGLNMGHPMRDVLTFLLL